VASTGRAGVAAAVAARPAFDAVLMDIQMPDIDGYAATAAIRRHDDMRSMPIIAMTANVMPEDRAACLAAGMNDHVGKPIDLDALVETVLRHCRRSRDATPPAAPTPAVLAATVSPDFERALRQIGGNTALFLKMSAMFGRATAGLAVDLQRHVLGEEKAAALRLLHTLQGTASTVGARQLADYALRLQQQLRAVDSTRAMPFSADEFEALIRQSCATLQGYADSLVVQPPPPTAAHTVLNKSAIAGILDELDALMRARNMRALSTFDELRAAYGPALADRLLALEQTISDLDFPASLECTRTLREALV
jgi:hypothetical protein